MLLPSPSYTRPPVPCFVGHALHSLPLSSRRVFFSLFSVFSQSYSFSYDEIGIAHGSFLSPTQALVNQTFSSSPSKRPSLSSSHSPVPTPHSRQSAQWHTQVLPPPAVTWNVLPPMAKARAFVESRISFISTRVSTHAGNNNGARADPDVFP